MDNKAILKAFADNQLLFDTVKGIVIAQFEKDNIDVDKYRDDELGQVVRAKVSGLRKVLDGFKEIEKYKSANDSPSNVNPAR